MGQGHSKIFWFATAGNLLVCGLLVAFTYLILELMGIAAGVETWPLWTCLAVGLPLTVICWKLAKGLGSARKRFWGYVLNGGTLLVYSLFVVSVVSLWFHTTRRTFLVPAGFQGELFVVHDPKSPGRGEKNLMRMVYRFPKDGVLVVSDPAPTFFSDRYEYLYSGSHTLDIADAGPGTLPDTAENRANKKEIVTYNGRTSYSGDHPQCPVEEISIGTRAFLLARQSESASPFITHPQICAK